MSLDEFLQVIIDAGGTIRTLAVGLFTYVIGWFLFLSGGWRLMKYSDPRRQYGMASVVVRITIGTLLIQSAQWINMAALTFTGYAASDSNAMSVMPSGGGPVEKVFQAALIWLAVLGTIAILHGAHLLVKGTESHGQSSDQDQFFTGLVYIFSGALGVNLYRFVGGLL